MRIRKCSAHGQIVCDCGSVLARCKCKGPVSTQLVECFHYQTPRELFEELVLNAAGAHAEHPARMVWACKRIAREERRKIDDVFLEIRAAVKERTGVDRLPGEALDIRLN